MAKTPKVKKREISIHSRAAKRGATPPKDLAVKPTAAETEYKPWLHNAHNAGITKKKKPKNLSSKQRQRQQKGLEHGERNMDRMEKKVTDSKIRGRKIKARATDWEELNDKIVGKENKSETKSADAVNEAEKDGPKAMEGVEQPDLEQPLPIRVAETTVEVEPPAEAGDEPLVEALAETTAQPEPAEVGTGLSVDDLDAVT